MKQKQLDIIIQRLKTEPKFLITVENKETGFFVCRKQSGEKLVNQYGSIENFFEEIYKNGHRKVGIQPFRKNGSSGTALDGYLEFTFSDDSQQQPATPPMTTAPTPAVPIYEMPVVGNFGSGLKGAVQLGLPELLQMHQAQNDNVRNAEENKYLKIRVDDLEKQVKSYEKKELQYEFSREERKERAESQKGYLEVFKSLAEPFMPVIAGKMMGAGAVAQATETALGNPAFSELKNEFLQVISSQNDVNIDILYRVLSGFDNGEFVNELVELLTKNKL